MNLIAFLPARSQPRLRTIRKSRRHPSLELQLLEDRTLLSAVLPNVPPAQGDPSEIVIIDSGVADAPVLVAGMLRGARVEYLDGSHDGVQQVADILAGYHDLSAVHIISHGSAGAVDLGSTVLDTASLERQAGLLQRWGEALSARGDILFYGCDVAVGSAGAAFVTQVATLTGADIAASMDRTGQGTAGQGGNWVLEAASGPIDTGVILASAAQKAFGHELAGEFTDMGALGLTGVFVSSVAWGDYDNDGDLDILLTGRDTGNVRISTVYRNDSGTFNDTSSGLTGAFNGSVAWGDCDNDGDLDILLTGRDNDDVPISKVYRNDVGIFTDISAGLSAVQSSAVAWGDYDNDGDLDILLTGYDFSTWISKVYRNDTGTFTDISAGLTGVAGANVAWGDYDNDGDLDILLAGHDGNIHISKVFRNDAGTFTDISAGLTGVTVANVAWGDYDNDGDLDILLTGRDGADSISTVYRNDAGTFNDISAGLTGVEIGSVAWGDYDNDGDLDILLTGTNSGNSLSKLYRNDAGTFTDIGAGLAGVLRSAVAWGDYDNDGDLDILLTGYNDNTNTAISKVYRNNATTANTAPAAPTGLSATIDSPTAVTLTWTPPADTQTPSAGLGYNLRVGTTPGGSDIVGPMANSSTGARRLPRPGAVQTASWQLTGLTPGQTYYWSVQAIDTALAGSPFAMEAPFNATLTLLNQTYFGGTGNETGTGIALVNTGSNYEVFASAGSDALDGEGLVIDYHVPYALSGIQQGWSQSWPGVAGPDGFQGIAATSSAVYAAGYSYSQTADTMGDKEQKGITVSFPPEGGSPNWAEQTPVAPGAFSYGGYESLRDVTTAVEGEQTVLYATGTAQSGVGANGGRLFLSKLDASGNVVWTRTDPAANPNSAGEKVVADGASVYVAGHTRDSGSAQAYLKKYDSNGVLSWAHASSAGDFHGLTLDAANGCLYAVGETAGANIEFLVEKWDLDGNQIWSQTYHRDGVQDVLNGVALLNNSVFAVGSTRSGTAGGSDGVVVEVDPATGALLSTTLWGGSADDSFQAVAATATGLHVVGTTRSFGAGGADVAYVVYQVTSPSTPFTDLGALGLPAAFLSSGAWGDYDSDGDLDILLTGRVSFTNSISKVYRNDAGAFTDISAVLTGVDVSAVAWGDYDNDGDLDILLTGRGNTDEFVTKVYRNDAGTFTEISAGLTGVWFSAVAWGDYDNDGDLDILLTGWDNTDTPISKVYRNDAGTFTDISAGLTGVGASAVAWGDYDNDGDLDILLTGWDNTDTPGTLISKVYRNDAGTFTDISAGLTGVFGSAVAWGDYDNDGDLDILLTGMDNDNVRISKLYRNDAGTFTDISAGLTGVNRSAVAWGDYDNDGDLDILLTGWSSGAYISKLYRNDAGTFTDISAGLTGVRVSSVAWGDYDNDGDLDILLTGQDNTGTRISKVYRNNATTANMVPAAPTGLSVTIDSGTAVTLTWTPPADTQTPSAGLSYNLRVGTTPGGSDIVGPMADNSTGARLVPRPGPIQGTSWQLTGLPPSQTFYWSVQAIDAALAGSPFATETVFSTQHIDVQGDTLYVTGTAQSDTLTFDTGSAHQIALNGVAYNFDAAVIHTIHYDALGGSDTATLTGTSGAEQAQLQPDFGSLYGTGYTVDATHVEAITVNAGAGTDSLKGANVANTWSVAGPGSGNLGGNHFTGVETLIGGTSNDSYVFDTDTPLGSVVLDEAAGGIDTLDFSGTSTRSVAVDLSNAAAQVINSNLTLTLSSASTIENAIGGTQADTLAGNGLNNNLIGRAGNDALHGGAGNDTYAFVADTYLGNDTITDDSGIDSIAFAGTNAAVNLYLSSTVAQTVNANLVLTLASGSAIENLNGGNGNDILKGNTLANTFIGGPGNDGLDGGAGNDVYSFVADTSLGSDTINDAAGLDTIGFDFTSAAVTFDLSRTTAQTVNANLVLTLTAGNAIENLAGGSGNDTLTGNILYNTISGRGGHDSISGGAGNDLLNGNAGNDSLSGGAGNDTYAFVADTALGSDTITDASEVDTLSFAGTTAAVTLDLSSTAAQTVNANLGLTLASGSAIENLTGGNGNDLLNGNALNNALIGNAGNDTLSGNAGNDILSGNAGNDALDGGAGNDTYAFLADTALGSDTLADASGIDTLSFAGTTAAVTVDLSSTAAQTVNDNLVLNLPSSTAIEHLTGGNGNDTLKGNTLTNILSGGPGNDVLDAGAGNDNYVFVAHSPLGNDTITDAAGLDNIDFRGTTGGVTFDLSKTTAQVVNAYLVLSLASGSAIENLYGGNGSDNLKGNDLNNSLIGNGGIDTLSGGNGNDTLTGSAGGSVLLGGAGADSLIGGAGRSFLIGGAGNDVLIGSGPKGDILINGTTSFDGNATALAAILIEWQSAATCSQRITNLRTGVGAGSAVKLIWATTVTDDGGTNSMRGQPSAIAEPGGDECDWFFSNFGVGADALPDKDAGEMLNNS